MSKYELSPDVQKSDKKNKCMIKEDPINKIVDHFYCGPDRSSYNYELLKRHNIKYIIRILPEFDFNRMYPGIKYIHIPIKDSETCGKTMNGLFNRISDFIHSKIILGQNVWIGCAQTHHRSMVLASAYLIKYRGYTINSAREHIRKLRPCALRRSNVCMYYALDAFQKSLQN